MVEKSIEERYDEAIECYSKNLVSASPDFSECESKFSSINTLMPSTYRERNLIANSNALVAKIKFDSAGLSYKIAEDAIQYFENSVSSYQQIIADKQRDKEKGIVTDPYDDQLYNVAFSYYNLGKIKEDLSNTEKSKAHQYPSLKKISDPKIEYMRAIESLIKIPAKNLSIRDLNLLGMAYLRLNDLALQMNT